MGCWGGVLVLLSFLFFLAFVFLMFTVHGVWKAPLRREDWERADGVRVGLLRGSGEGENVLPEQ